LECNVETTNQIGRNNQSKWNVMQKQPIKLEWPISNVETANQIGMAYKKQEWPISNVIKLEWQTRMAHK
jgi:hypothetical protein